MTCVPLSFSSTQIHASPNLSFAAGVNPNILPSPACDTFGMRALHFISGRILQELPLLTLGDNSFLLANIKALFLTSCSWIILCIDALILQ